MISVLLRLTPKSDIIDISDMLKEEKDFYDQLMELLDGYRNGILMSLFKRTTLILGGR